MPMLLPKPHGFAPPIWGQPRTPSLSVARGWELCFPGWAQERLTPGGPAHSVHSAKKVFFTEVLEAQVALSSSSQEQV